MEGERYFRRDLILGVNRIDSDFKVSYKVWSLEIEIIDVLSFEIISYIMLFYYIFRFFLQ